MKLPRRTSKSPDEGFLEGQLLIAMPGMSDRRFARSVIYMCAHSSEGAMGLIINQRANHIELAELLKQLGIVASGEGGALPSVLEGKLVHIGGPVSTERGFVLHSRDYFVSDASIQIADDVCLTATIDILKALARGKGPRRFILALGYAGWDAGQLESEIAANGWLHCPADPDLIFGDIEAKYDLALGKLGVSLSHLSSEAGHA